MLSIFFSLFQHQGFKLGLCFVDFAHKIVVYCLDAYEMVIRDDNGVETMLDAQCCVRQMPMIGSFLSHLALHFPLRMFYERIARLQLIAENKSYLQWNGSIFHFDLCHSYKLRFIRMNLAARRLPFRWAVRRRRLCVIFRFTREIPFWHFAYKIKTMFSNEFCHRKWMRIWGEIGNVGCEFWLNAAKLMPKRNKLRKEKYKASPDCDECLERTQSV